MTPAFDAASEALARATRMTPTQARGTFRLALKSTGVDPRIALRADLLAVVPRLAELVASYRLRFDEAGMAAVRAAIDAAPETNEVALDFFKGID